MTDGNLKIMIDPYLSDSVSKVETEKHRRQPVLEDIFDTEPDVMIFTHDHLDHFDPETAPRFLSGNRKPITVLAPSSVWHKVRAYGGVNNYVQFNRYAEWTEGDIRFSAVKAEHSDPHAIGVIIEELETGKIYYVTGDTLYSREILSELPKNIDVTFLPINGVGNNMNVRDAERFSRDCGTKRAVPYHVGMFDSLTPETFKSEKRLILKLYEETEM